MADNTTIKDGGGSNVTAATKDIGGVQFPKVIAHGADGNPLIPSAAALADAATSNPTTAIIGAIIEAVQAGDSTKVDRLIQDAKALRVSLIVKKTNAGDTVLTLGSATGANSIPVVIASDQTLPLPTGASTAAKQPALGTAGTASADVISIQGIASMTAVKVDGSAVTQPVSLAAATSGGSTPYRNIDLGVTGQVIKNGAGQIYGITLMNRAAAERFFKFYDKATAPTQADTPVITYAMPATSNMVIASPDGVAYASGISVRATTGIADNDTGAPPTNDCVLSVRYK